MKKILILLFIMFITSFSFGQINASNGYGFMYEPAFSVAGQDTVISNWIGVGEKPNIELGFAVSANSKFEIVVYYQAGVSITQYATVTADTLINTVTTGGFVTKILRSTSVNLIPAATFIRIRAVRIATGSATSIVLQGRIVFRN